MGAAVALYKVGSEPKVLKSQLGPLDAHMTFEVEAVGLLLALHLLSLERDACSATIMLDNQAIIQTLEHHKPKLAQYIIDKLMRQISMVYCQARNPDFELSIMWVKGHTNIEGNELVDSAAKLAMGGELSTASLLPLMLTSLLPVSITAHKQAFAISLHEQWRETWKQLPQYPRLSKINHFFPLNKYRKLIHKFSQVSPGCRIIMQLRSGHMPLNAYLHRVSKLDQPSCAQCKTGEETVYHYLFDCGAWKHEH